jgi:hypothetical protein
MECSGSSSLEKAKEWMKRAEAERKEDDEGFGCDEECCLLRSFSYAILSMAESQKDRIRE